MIANTAGEEIHLREWKPQITFTCIEYWDYLRRLTQLDTVVNQNNARITLLSRNIAIGSKQSKSVIDIVDKFHNSCGGLLIKHTSHGREKRQPIFMKQFTGIDIVHEVHGDSTNEFAHGITIFLCLLLELVAVIRLQLRRILIANFFALQQIARVREKYGCSRTVHESHCPFHRRLIPCLLVKREVIDV
jgi:hypothetical protein